MRLALIGHGSMGSLVDHLVTSQGRQRNEEIGIVLKSKDDSKSIDELAFELRDHDAAIDFSVSSAVLRNVLACAVAGVPLVEGTTGWKDQEAEARKIVNQHDATLVYGANFSIGVNIFYRIVSQAAKLLAAFEAYQAFIEEEHHSRKKDAPSGTALKLKEVMSEHLASEVPIASMRAGHIPGTHRVGFDSAPDQILLTHMARSREGFASGALMAARWIVGRKGIYEFSEVIDEVLRSNDQ
ncbi:MAG: 4-hydroxy-tetrahydrodipicolinate reductase [Pyrinomonadaceae bacterium]